MDVTRRLYEEDAYLRAFDARVVRCVQDEKGYRIQLDQTCFYPEGGGQPGDRGTLLSGSLSLSVFDTQVDEAGTVWHLAEGPLREGDGVRGQIDWDRRFDHMQQHAGEHILAGCLWELEKGYTHGLHIGAAFSSIDATMPGGATRLPEERLRAIELLANARAQSDAPMRAWFPGEEELRALPLRKAPAVTERVRVVSAGDFEMVACGGTHPRSTGQIGPITILSAEPARGKMRLSFVCGMRAVRHARDTLRAAQQAARLLSSPVEDLPEAVQRLKDEGAHLSMQIKTMEKQRMLLEAERLKGKAEPLPGGGSLVFAALEGAGRDALTALGQALAGEPGMVALLQSKGPQGYSLLFCRHPEAPGDMARLMREAGARGGGKPDFAQGSAAGDGALPLARRILLGERGDPRGGLD